MEVFHYCIMLVFFKAHTTFENIHIWMHKRNKWIRSIKPSPATKMYDVYVLYEPSFAQYLFQLSCRLRYILILKLFFGHSSFKWSEIYKSLNSLWQFCEIIRDRQVPNPLFLNTKQIEMVLQVQFFFTKNFVSEQTKPFRYFK